MVQNQRERDMKPKAVAARLAGGSDKAGLHSLPGLRKIHDIHFSALPPGQTEQAATLLARLEEIKVEQIDALCVRVHYDILDHTLEALESALIAQGFHLDNSLYSKLVRALVYYCEDIQLHNLLTPQRLIKKSNEAYIEAWTRHPHGDHDDTPLELRHDK